MNKYRVDRNNSPVTPCGMNGLLYVGDNYAIAQTRFDFAKTGVDAWGKDNPSYGVILSQWDEATQSYRAIRSRGFSKLDPASIGPFTAAAALTASLKEG